MRTVVFTVTRYYSVRTAHPTIEWVLLIKNGGAPLLIHRRGYARPCAVSLRTTYYGAPGNV